MKRIGGLLAMLCALLGAASYAFAAPRTAEQRMQEVVGEIPPAIELSGVPAERATLLQLMKRLNVPGVSVAVIRNGQIDWAAGFGTSGASRAPITSTTLFQAASISKVVTAVAVLQLVQSGRWDLDVDVDRYLHNWHLPASSLAATHPITLRELLNHSAGLSVQGFKGYGPSDALPTAVQILDGVAPASTDAVEVITVPGTRWWYSGGGYTILREALEEATGQPFPELIKERVLQPVGMGQSTFEQPLPSSLRGLAAVPADGEGRPLPGGARTYPEIAPDGLWSTPSDLAHFVIALQHALAGRSGAILSKAMAQAMMTPGLNNWGLGPQVGDDPRHLYFAHQGNNAGYRSLMIGYKSGNGVVIMTNGAQGDELGIAVARSVAQVYQWPDFRPTRFKIADLTAAALDRYVGAYRSQDGIYYVISRQGSRLFAHVTGQDRQRLFPLQSGRFLLEGVNEGTDYPRDDFYEVSFQADDQGRLRGLSVLLDGRSVVIQAKRLSDEAALPIVAAMTSLERRIAAGRSREGEQGLLRALIVSTAAGHPDDAPMTTYFARATRYYLSRQVLADLGPIKSMTFERALPDGADVYRIRFQHGETDCEIRLNGSGRIADATLLW